MTQIVICEFITGGGFAAEALPSGLAREGEAMLQSLLQDLDAIDGLHLQVCRDVRLAAPTEAGSILWIGAGDDPWQHWQAAMQGCDCFWPIAPETGGALERLVHMAEQAGVAVVACSAEAIACCASKTATCARLQQHGIAATPIVDATVWSTQTADKGWIHKPDDGAGCEDTRFFSDPVALADWADAHDGIVQEYIDGEALSLAVLVTDKVRLLSINRQRVNISKGRLIHQGVDIDIVYPRRQHLQQLAQQVVSAVPGLDGYLGIDFIDAQSGPIVLEINPRLTSSWVGLSERIGVNIAERILQHGGWLD